MGGNQWRYEFRPRHQSAAAADARRFYYGGGGGSSALGGSAKPNDGRFRPRLEHCVRCDGRAVLRVSVMVSMVFAGNCDAAQSIQNSIYLFLCIDPLFCYTLSRITPY